jgi:hypothetical protein
VITIGTALPTKAQGAPQPKTEEWNVPPASVDYGAAHDSLKPYPETRRATAESLVWSKPRAVDHHPTALYGTGSNTSIAAS